MAQPRLKPRRIGMMGGAFDPPHHTHVALAEAACAQLRLDELRVVPTGQAWHKTRSLSAPEHRLAMVRLAFAGVAKAVVDDCEIRRSGPSYTIDTLLTIRNDAMGGGSAVWADGAQTSGVVPDLFLIVGSDQAQALPRWHRYAEVLEIATICVAVRAYPARKNSQFDVIKSAPEDRTAAAHAVTLSMPASSLSATEIRARIARREDVAPLVGDPVARYIAHHHLYLEP
jgi:nicotinate-nucleotide adenylyltransferase